MPLNVDPCNTQTHPVQLHLLGRVKGFCFAPFDFLLPFQLLKHILAFCCKGSNTSININLLLVYIVFSHFCYVAISLKQLLF